MSGHECRNPPLLSSTSQNQKRSPSRTNGERDLFHVFAGTNSTSHLISYNDINHVCDVDDSQEAAFHFTDFVVCT